MAFGKRTTPVGQASPASAQTAPTGPASSSATAEAPGSQASAPNDERPPQQKVSPDEVWEGETGDFLRLFGKSPDDESSLVPDEHSINARLERDRAGHEAKLAEMNHSVADRFPGGSMQPFSLLPDRCWNGEMGHFLMMRLGLFPYDDWNMIFLPADAATADALNLPPHPNGDIPAFVVAAEAFLSDAAARLSAAHARAERTHDFGTFQEVQEEICEKVKGLARNFLGELDKAWEDRDR